MIEWNGQQVLDEIAHRIDNSAITIGREFVKIAQRMASGPPGPTPRSGKLRSSIDYDYNPTTHTIQFIVGVPYGIFVEFGTRHSRAYPFIRPAINALKTIYGFETEMHFGAFETDKELLFGGGRYIGGKGLTSGQKRHVRENLKPKAIMHHVGNVTRAKMVVHHHRKSF